MGRPSYEGVCTLHIRDLKGKLYSICISSSKGQFGCSFITPGTILISQCIFRRTYDRQPGDRNQKYNFSVSHPPSCFLLSWLVPLFSALSHHSMETASSVLSPLHVLKSGLGNHRMSLIVFLFYSLVENDFPHISWVPCASICLRLLTNNLGKNFWISIIFNQTKRMINFM